MTKKQIRRAINIYAAAFLYHGQCDFPDWMTERDREVFRTEIKERALEILDRTRSPGIPVSLEACLLIARDNVAEK